MNILEKMISLSDNFTKTENQIFEFAKNNMEAISRETTIAITEKYGFSQPALTRFAKKLGYSGYSEFKYEISRFRMNKSSELKQSSVANSYLNAFNIIDSKVNFSKIINSIKKSQNIIISGYHRSKISAQLFTFNLTDFKYNAFFMQHDEIFKANTFVSEKDLIIIFSVKSDVYLEVIKNINELKNKPKTILINQSENHPLSKYFDLTITLPSAKSLGLDFFMESNIMFQYYITQLVAKL